MVNAVEKLAVLSPFNQSVIEELSYNRASDVENALDRAHKAFLNRDQWLPPYKRIEILEKLAILVEKNRDCLIEIAVKEGGKPYIDTDIEVARAIQGVKLGITAIHQLHGEEVPMGLTAPSVNRMGFTFYEPIGVVVSLSAFNHPVNLIIHQTIPAIAAGCPVIVKPAPDTPLSCIEMVKLIHEAGLPEEWCQVLITDNVNAEKLATDHRVGYLSFIGSAKVGWYLRSKLARGARCALEHGGVAPVILDRLESFDAIAAPLAKGAFYHAGQVCVSVQRVYVPEDQAETLAEALKKEAVKMPVGDPMDKGTAVGPLIRPGEVTRVSEWVNEAIAQGATLVCGGSKKGDYCFEPTILLNPSLESKISREEIFGPVVAIYGYRELDEAIASANSLEFAFQASIFTQNLDNALYAVQRLNASAVMVNDHTAFRVDWMPFGGRDSSGLGLGGISHSAKEMSRVKLMVLKSPKLA